jgi:hypothetical protein
MVKGFQYEEPKGKPRFKVEHYGSPEKCTYCDKAPIAIADCWLDSETCMERYVCREHLLMLRMDFGRKRYKEFGYRYLPVTFGAPKKEGAQP